MLDLSILGVTMRMAAPILLAGTGTLYNDRAGVTNITLEGSMLLGGFFCSCMQLFYRQLGIGYFGRNWYRSHYLSGVLFSNKCVRRR